MGVRDWAIEQKRVYFGNASSVRDFRSQLRGKKAAVLWGTYLVVLILLALLAYAAVVSQGAQSVARVQAELKGFYDTIRWMLETAVFLVAPIIVSASIQGEIGRKALDLIVSAPVSPKYYLVGKVVSGFRTIVMLLFLSLPISAAAVVLGGATWSEVLVTYWIIALHGLLCIVVTLPIAVIGTKIVPVVFYGYLTCIAWAYVGSVVYAIFSGARGPSGSSALALVFPFGLVGDVTDKTELLGVNVPNWMLTTLIVALVSKLFLLGAGSAMTRYRSKETASLRIHGLVYIAAFSLAIFLGGIGVPTFGATLYMSAWTFILATAPLVFAVPYLCCWSPVEERKHRTEGWFNPRHMLTGAPEGGLPYLLALLASVFFAMILAAQFFGYMMDETNYYALAWIASLWIMYWSVGWIVSAFNRQGVGMARRAHFALTFLGLLVPVPILAYLQEATGSDVLFLHPFATLGNSASNEIVLLHAAIMLAIAFVLLRIGEARRKAGVLLKKRSNNEQPSH